MWRKRKGEVYQKAGNGKSDGGEWGDKGREEGEVQGMCIMHLKYRSPSLCIYDGCSQEFGGARETVEALAGGDLDIHVLPTQTLPDMFHQVTL